MSRICAVLGVMEGQCFRFEGKRYRIDGQRLVRMNEDGTERARLGSVRIMMIEAPDKIIVERERFNRWQALALQAICLLYGYGWLVSPDGQHLSFSADRPEKKAGRWYSASGKLRDLHLTGDCYTGIACKCKEMPLGLFDALAECGYHAETID